MYYAHTNIIAYDWQKLSDFYQRVFACEIVPPLRDQSGQWLDDATAVNNAALKGVHLRLPGHGENGPTLEIYSYSEIEPALPQIANRAGFGHIAFCVEDVQAVLQNLLSHGGKEVGKIVTKQVAEQKFLTFVYAADPEGNLIEIQCWSEHAPT